MPPSVTPEQFLSQFPPHICRLAAELGKLVKQTIPSVAEEVRIGWKLIGYRTSRKNSRYFLLFVGPLGKEQEGG